jgi:hypothetical protein
MSGGITHGLPVTQPWGWALAEGHLEIVNLDLPPKPEMVGTRIGIVASELDAEHAWVLRELYGVPLPMASGYLDRRATKLGLIATAELSGWMRFYRGKVTETFRPGSDKPFRARKSLVGPFGWVLHRVKPANADAGNLRMIRGRFWETKAYEEQLMCYAETHGCDGFTQCQLKQLRRLGFFEPATKGKAESGTKA